MALNTMSPAEFTKRAQQTASGSVKSTAIGGMAIMLESAKRIAMESTFTSEPMTKEQAFARILANNPKLYSAYKAEKKVVQFRFKCGDESVANELLALQSR